MSSKALMCGCIACGGRAVCPQRQGDDKGARPHSTGQGLTDKTTDIQNISWSCRRTRAVPVMCLSGQSCPGPHGEGSWASQAWGLQMASGPQEPWPSSLAGTQLRAPPFAGSSLRVWRKEWTRGASIPAVKSLLFTSTSRRVLFRAVPGHSCHANRGSGMVK